jgi:hypothetical protein
MVEMLQLSNNTDLHSHFACKINVINKQKSRIYNNKQLQKNIIRL